MLTQASINVPQLISAFKGAPDVTEERRRRRQLRRTKGRSQHRRRCRRRLGSDKIQSISSFQVDKEKKKPSTSTSGSSNLKPEAVNNMRTEYLANLADFHGQQWLLPSGATLSGLFRPYLVNLSRGSVLHSWIIDNLETVVALTKDPKDKEELRLVLSVEDQDKWTLQETGPFGHIRDTHLRRHRHLLQLEVPPWFLPTFVQWKHPHTPA